MATKKVKELKNLSATEVTTKLRELGGQLFDAKMKRVTGQLADSATGWRLRKSVARLKTMQRQEALKGAAAGGK